MRIEFTVGKIEKHTVGFKWSQFFGTSSITVDGRVVKRGKPVALDELKLLANKYKFVYDMIVKRTIPWQRIRAWELEVGEREPHYVRIDKERPKLLAGLRPCEYRVFIDGELILSKRGY